MEYLINSNPLVTRRQIVAHVTVWEDAELGIRSRFIHISGWHRGGSLST